MAATRKGNVIISSTSGDTTGPVVVTAIKVVGTGGGATFQLKSDNVTGGTVVYECTVGASSEKYEQLELRDKTGLYVNISAGAGTIYLYTPVEY